MSSLGGRYTFLSASFPSGEGGRAVQPCDPSAVGDAVTALVRAVLSHDGRLLLGGHPVITPLVLAIAMERDAKHSVDVFQSKWFQNQVTPETRRLAELGYGRIHWTNRGRDLDSTLKTMREQMMSVARVAGAVFVGGMDDVEEEYGLVGRMLPGVPRIPLRGPGGAAASLQTTDIEVPEGLARQLESRAYPFLSAKIVAHLCATDDRECSKHERHWPCPSR